MADLVSGTASAGSEGPEAARRYSQKTRQTREQVSERRVKQRAQETKRKEKKMERETSIFQRPGMGGRGFENSHLGILAVLRRRPVAAESVASVAACEAGLGRAGCGISRPSSAPWGMAAGSWRRHVTVSYVSGDHQPPPFSALSS